MINDSATDLNTCDKYGRNALHLAAEKGCTSLVQTLLNRNKSMLDVQDNNKCTALHFAIANFHPEIVITLLAAGANTAIKNNDGETPLMLAINNINEKSIEALVNHPDINLTDRNFDGRIALHFAAAYNNSLLVKRLLEKNKSMVDAQDIDKQTALHLAVKNNYLGIVKILLAAGANPNIKNCDNETPLMLAFKYGCTKIFETLMNHTDINLTDCNIDGWNTLHFAALCGNTLVVNTILEKNKSMLDVQTNHKDTALHIAVKNNNLEIIITLLAVGANPDIKNKYGETPLMLAIKFKNEKAIKVLINHPTINLCICNNTGLNALHYAALCDNIIFVQTLIDKYKFMLNMQTSDGLTALHIAAENCHQDIIITLLAAGANPDIKNMYGETPLMLSIRNKCEKAIEALISHPTINLNACNGDGLTALHIAVVNNYPDIIKILLAAGANPDIKNRDDNTPEQLARIMGLTDILEIFTRNATTQLNTLNLNTKIESNPVEKVKCIKLFDYQSLSANDVEQPTIKMRRLN